MTKKKSKSSIPWWKLILVSKVRKNFQTFQSNCFSVAMNTDLWRSDEDLRSFEIFMRVT